MLNGLLSTAEVARKLGVTRQRVLEFIKTDRLRAKKVGRSYVVHSKDVLSLSRFKVGRPAANGPARGKIQKTKSTKR
jgi:excisionase family DNA binding protein